MAGYMAIKLRIWQPKMIIFKRLFPEYRVLISDHILRLIKSSSVISNFSRASWLGNRGYCPHNYRKEILI